MLFYYNWCSNFNKNEPYSLKQLFLPYDDIKKIFACSHGPSTHFPLELGLSPTPTSYVNYYWLKMLGYDRLSRIPDEG